MQEQTSRYEPTERGGITTRSPMYWRRLEKQTLLGYTTDSRGGVKTDRCPGSIFEWLAAEKRTGVDHAQNTDSNRR